MGFHQREGHSSADEHERELLSRHGTGTAAQWGNWLVQSNAETGEGYSDISVSTPARVGIVIELKYANNGNLEAACTEALRQIEKRKYTEGLQRQGMKKSSSTGWHSGRKNVWWL